MRGADDHRAHRRAPPGQRLTYSAASSAGPRSASTKDGEDRPRVLHGPGNPPPPPWPNMGERWESDPQTCDQHPHDWALMGHAMNMGLT